MQTYNRDTWNIYFLEFNKDGDVVTVEGSVPDYLRPESFKESLTINGQKYEIALAVTLPESSSSSEPQVSSSSENPSTSSSEGLPETSSSSTPASSSSDGSTIAMSPVANLLSVVVAGRTLHVSGASHMDVQIFDMQGRPLISRTQVVSSVSLESLHQGNYVVRVVSGSMTLVRRITVR